ncbi:MAG: (Fe-S)-binding protein [Zoogloea sp.]|uniref:(Fe-S)-binding protein n=1 Tax=Zoogloea sp. TaxID=49181 RepID=UPI003F3BD33E
MKHHLDWSSYETAGQGDAYAGIPATGGDFARAVAVCISDRQCQRSPKGVMCPSFRATQDPVQSPGGRVVLLKAALNGELGLTPFTHPELAAAMDLCVGCKGCKRECANQVDMAALKIEYQAQRNALNGVRLRDRLFAAMPRLLARHPGSVRNLIKLRDRIPGAAQLAERLVGIAAQRQLPLPAPPPFVAPEPQGEGRTVILFVDTFARHFSPSIADAACQVLTRGGYRVQVLEPAPDDAEADRPLCCGRTYLSLGQVEAARHEAQRMQRALRPALASGHPIIGLEPSCILSLRDDHLKLGLGPEAEALARQVHLFEEFIAREHDRKQLQLPLQPLLGPRLLVHGHCHQKAVGAMKSMRKVLRLIPALDFEFIESSCCGMGGSFGLEAEHAALADAMGELALFPAIRNAPTSPLLANGFSCRGHCEEATGRRGLHVAEILLHSLDGTALSPTEVA